MTYIYFCIPEKYEDTKGEIRSRKSKIPKGKSKLNMELHKNPLQIGENSIII